MPLPTKSEVKHYLAEKARTAKDIHDITIRLQSPFLLSPSIRAQTDGCRETEAIVS